MEDLISKVETNGWVYVEYLSVELKQYLETIKGFKIINSAIGYFVYSKGLLPSVNLAEC